MPGGNLCREDAPSGYFRCYSFRAAQPVRLRIVLNNQSFLIYFFFLHSVASPYRATTVSGCSQPIDLLDGTTNDTTIRTFN